MAFSWLIAGADAHAKNYSLLLGGRRTRLAPLYDVASILPYEGFAFPKIKLARKFDGEYKLSLIGRHQWQKFAREVRVDADEFVLRLAATATRLPDEVNDTCLSANKQGLNAPIIGKLAKQLTARAGACAKSLGAGRPTSASVTPDNLS